VSICSQDLYLKEGLFLMNRRAVSLFVLLVLTSCLAFAQRSRNPMEPMRPDGDEGADKELVVHVVFANDRSAGEQIDVLLQSPQGGTVAESFTNNEGKATFQGIRPGTYIVRVRGIDIKDKVTDVFAIESFERSHHHYVETQPLEAGNVNEPTQGTATAAELERVPENARKEFEQGNQALAAGDRGDAIEHLQKATALYPKFVIAYNNLAAAYMKTRDFNHAREALDEALRVDPERPLTKANLVRLVLLDHKYADAIALLEKELAKNAKNPEFLFLMCEAQFFSGDYDQALLYARKVCALGHRNFEMAHIFAGRALEAQKRPDEARIEYAALLQESPAAPEAAEASRSLVRLDSVAKTQ
jgi:Flp pilus assembly protein TadD